MTLSLLILVLFSFYFILPVTENDISLSKHGVSRTLQKMRIKSEKKKAANSSSNSNSSINNTESASHSFLDSVEKYSLGSLLITCSQSLSPAIILTLNDCLFSMREGGLGGGRGTAGGVKKYCSSVKTGGWVVGRKIRHREVYCVFDKTYKSCEAVEPVVDRIVEKLIGV